MSLCRKNGMKEKEKHTLISDKLEGRHVFFADDGNELDRGDLFTFNVT
jgi:hypothetical protein